MSDTKENKYNESFNKFSYQPTKQRSYQPKNNSANSSYQQSHNNSSNNSNKKNIVLHSNYSVKIKPKLSHDNMKAITNLNEKDIKTGRNKLNNL